MNSEKLVVVWSSGDPEVAHKACFMYTHAAQRNGWFDEITLVVWGPSAALLARDASLQQRIREMGADGVVLEACKACSDSYGASDALAGLGIDVKYMGSPLTEMLKEGRRVLCF
jgi:hypothetical protein